MTKQQFDNYKFSAKTEVKLCIGWRKVLGVDFEDRDVLLEDDTWYSIKEIEDIRN